VAAEASSPFARFVGKTARRPFGDTIAESRVALEDALGRAGDVLGEQGARPLHVAPERRLDERSMLRVDIALGLPVPLRQAAVPLALAEELLVKPEEERRAARAEESTVERGVLFLPGVVESATLPRSPRHP
jgi:hypothetical protein